MENLKPTQNHEQERPKTLEDYAVKTFPADLDVATRPLTVIRSGQDGGGVRSDGGWIPGDMLCVCDTDSEEGISTPELFLKVHKPIKVVKDNKEEYVVAEKIVALNRLRSREENVGFTEFYIQVRYGKSTKEMLEEGRKAAEDIWQQKHPVDNSPEYLTPEVRPESSSDGLAVENISDHGKPSAKEVSSMMGNVASKVVEDIWQQEHPVDNEPEPLATDMHLENSSDNPELERFDKRVRELMRPLETDVDGMPFREDYTCVKSNFEYLFDPNYVPSNNVEDAAVRNPKGLPVSEGSFNAAKGVIDNLVTNLSLMQIIDPERALDPRVIMNNIRSSHITRCRLFEYLASRLDRLAIVNPGDLADRALRNSGDNLKSPNYLGGGYYEGKMRSREYVVVLAIAMMDGSFDVGRQDKMVTHYRNGEGRSGMHRDSARTLLEYVGNSY